MSIFSQIVIFWSILFTNFFWIGYLLERKILEQGNYGVKTNFGGHTTVYKSKSRDQFSEGNMITESTPKEDLVTMAIDSDKTLGRFKSDDNLENDQRIPVYEKGRPSRVRENAAFLVDLRCFENWEDIKSDLNGVYDGVVRCGISTVEYVEGKWVLLVRKEIHLHNDNTFHLIQNTRRNKAASQLVRSIFLLRDQDKKFVNDVCLLQYNVSNEAGFVQLDVQRHGNSKSALQKPFYPTKKSTMTAMKQKLKSNESSIVYEELRVAGGGMSAARAPSDLPRGMAQIYQAKFREVKHGSNDDVSDLLKYARDREDLLLHHSDYPNDLWITGTKAMCHDIGRFTTSEIMSYPVSVDPTFNLGRFEVTPIVYRNLLLTSKRTKESPVFLGPTMIHHNKTGSTYRVLASTCVRHCPGFENAKGFITDGELELQNAFKEELKDAKALRCFKHFEKNCTKKLRTIGIREKKFQQFFIDKTFGVLGKCEGILDATGRHDLRKRLDDVREEMNAKEREILQKDQSYIPRF
eukprot:Seg1645.5 transcript_id=Seg1645.5/GoldUCD/mRNA.D3Y31 product="hypothetical protein" protein_id=Seg1645.5/GoldUCD/D3Y31